METNVGVLDGFVRLAAGAFLLAWSEGEFGLTPPSFGNWFIWLLGLGLVLTWLFHHCVFYRILGTNSCARSPGDADDESEIRNGSQETH
jgi:hypothetical protein